MGIIRLRTLNVSASHLDELVKAIKVFFDEVDVRTQTMSTFANAILVSLHVYTDDEASALALMNVVEPWARRQRIKATIFGPDGDVVMRL